MQKYKKVLIGGFVVLIPVHQAMPAKDDEAVRPDEVHQENYDPMNMVGRPAIEMQVSSSASSITSGVASRIAKYGGITFKLK